jgi:hypothetical protein
MKTKIQIINEATRSRAIEAVRALRFDEPHTVKISPEKKETRSTIQNCRMWAMLGDISKQVVWHGQKLTPENWKDMATAALKRQQVVPGIDGGFVVLGTSTSRMTVAEMCELTEFLFAFGVEHRVCWSDPTMPQDER